MIRPFLALLVLTASAVSAQAQVQPWPARPGQTVDQGRWQADQHRYEMDRLRARADQREAFARQVELETRLNRMEIEARRRPGPDVAPTPPALRSPEQERAARQAASDRRRRTQAGVGEIDAWLDRPPQ